jgi:hypothetical protein
MDRLMQARFVLALCFIILMEDKWRLSALLKRRD